MDGLDLAAVRFETTEDHTGFELLACQTDPWSAEWLDRLRNLPEAPAALYAKTHSDFGHLCGMMLRRFLLTHDLKPDFVASHGHTVFHQPHKHFTAQIGCGQTMASYVNCPVVNNFRPRDIAQGGEGAPLVPFGELKLFADYSLFLNLGGIANLSILQRPGKQAWSLVSRLRKSPTHLACDICPVNQVLDTLAHRHNPELRYDPEGEIARSGELLPELLIQLEGLPFYAMLPPRSLGREWLDEDVWPLLNASRAPLPDLLHTWCEHVALRIADECQRQNLRNAEILTTGGGAHNHFLIERLQARLEPLSIRLVVPDRLQIEYKEALIFAYLGLCTLQGQPNVLHEATGARKASVLGAIHLPDRGLNAGGAWFW